MTVHSMESHDAHDTTVVTGATGFLGTRLVQALVSRGSSVVAVGREGASAEGTTLRTGDLADPAFCADVLQGAGTVYYLAGSKKNLYHHTNAPYDFVRGNVVPFLAFLDAARVAAVKRIVYMSSTHAATAWQLGNDGYAVGKHINELAAQAFTAQTGIPVTIVRSCGMYGPGDRFDPVEANFIPSLICRIDAAGDSFPVWGAGERRMQFIYIDDVVANVIAAADLGATTVTIGNPEAKSVNEIVAMLMAIMGRSCAVTHDLSKPDKETELFTFTNPVVPGVDMALGLERTVAYYRDHKHA